MFRYVCRKGTRLAHFQTEQGEGVILTVPRTTIAANSFSGDEAALALGLPGHSSHRTSFQAEYPLPKRYLSFPAVSFQPSFLYLLREQVIIQSVAYIIPGWRH